MYQKGTAKRRTTNLANTPEVAHNAADFINYFSTSNNLSGMNPLFTNPAASVLTLQSGSPAIGYGQSESYVPSWLTDAGAY